jgi:hypothetical protein
MKNKILTLIFSVCLGSASATDLYVNGSGNANTYSTIQAAVNAAVSGDNIYISTVGTFNEAVAIISKSIFLIPAVAGEEYTIANGVSFGGYNHETTIIGMWNASITHNAGVLNIIDCDINSISSGSGTTNLYSSIVHNGANIRGNISGCTFESGLTFTPGSPVGKACGNKIIGNVTVNGSGYMEISNNYVEGWLNIQTLKITAGGANYINNNTINSTTYGLVMPYYGYSYNNTLIVNNFIKTTSSSLQTNSAIVVINPNNYYAYELSGSNYFIANNYYDGFTKLVSNSSSTIIDNGTTSSNWAFSTTSGELSGTSGEDLGLDQIEFRDIDNSINDIGTSGGPHAWSNYNQTSGKAAVVELDLPFQLYIGGNHSINAKAIHKN